MNRAVYDTRFFAEFFQTKDEDLLQRIKKEKKRKEKYVSSVTIHEVCKFSIVQEDKETAKLRAALIRNDFRTVPVDDQIAECSAGLRHKYRLSMGDSMIAATALTLNAVCISDDPHFKQIKEIKTVWI
jgi:predicted nucleic acid-binding protein